MIRETHQIILDGLTDYYARKGAGVPLAGPRYVRGWPAAVIARYLTVGQAHVDITYVEFGDVHATCRGCEWTERKTSYVLHGEPPEEEADHVAEDVKILRRPAQQHAAECRAVEAPSGH